MEIINKRLFFELALTVTVYLIVWSVLLNLGLRVLGKKIMVHKVLVAALVMSIFSLFGKQVVSNLIFGLIAIALIGLLLKIVGRTSILKAFWAAIIVYFILGVGTITIQGPICSLNNKLILFFLRTPIGNIVGSLIEMIFPAVATFFLATFNISLIPPLRKNFSKLEFVGLLLFGVLFFLIYNLSIEVSTSLINNTKQFTMANMFSEWFTTVVGLVAFYIFYSLTKKQFKLEQDKHHLLFKHSRRLLDTLDSERRLLRDRLQTVSMMLESDKIQELANFVHEISTEISRVPVENTDNPVLIAAILSQQVIAKEKGVEICVNNSLENDIPIDFDILGEIVSILLDIFIETEIEANVVLKIVSLNIEEDEKNYYFKFKNSDTAVKSLESKSRRDYKLAFFLTHKEEKLEIEKFTIVDKLMKEIGGVPSYIRRSRRVVELILKIKKSRLNSDDAGKI